MVDRLKRAKGGNKTAIKGDEQEYKRAWGKTTSDYTLKI